MIEIVDDMLTVDMMYKISSLTKRKYGNTPQTLAEIFVPYMNKYFIEFGIDSPIKVCHYLAQVLHESGSLRYTEELASGKAYEGRKDLGNVMKGDGVKYKGRGLIQLTGRKNYQRYKNFCGYDVINKPQLLSMPLGATRSSCWFFTKGCGRNLCGYAVADDGTNTEQILRSITKVINGGYNGLDSRRQFLERAKNVLLKKE